MEEKCVVMALKYWKDSRRAGVGVRSGVETI